MSQQPHIQQVNMIASGNIVPISGSMPYISIPVSGLGTNNSPYVRPVSTIGPTHIVGNSYCVTPTQLSLSSQPSTVTTSFGNLQPHRMTMSGTTSTVVTHQQQQQLQQHQQQQQQQQSQQQQQQQQQQTQIHLSNASNGSVPIMGSSVTPASSTNATPPVKDKGPLYFPIEQIMREVDPQMMISDDVDESIQIILGSFVEKIASMGAEAAVHRGHNTVTAADINLILNLHTDYGPNRVALKHKKFDKHRQRMAMIRKSASVPFKRN